MPARIRKLEDRLAVDLEEIERRLLRVVLRQAAAEGMKFTPSCRSDVEEARVRGDTLLHEAALRGASKWLCPLWPIC